MEQWNEHNQSAIMEYPFDLEQYIEERIREIDDLDERRFAKKVLMEGLGKVARCIEDKYKGLERRIYDELETEGNRYETVITVIRREHYDPTNQTLFPVAEEDLEVKGRFARQSSETEYYTGTIFLQADEKTAERFGKEGSFPGTLLGEEEKSVVFHIRRAERYRKQVEQLYHAFLDNHIPWMTVHMGYLDRFFDLFVEMPESIEGVKDQRIFAEQPRDAGGADIGGTAEAGQFPNARIDFGEFEEAVIFDMIPLWNIERIRFDSATFMVPCIDEIYYEHEFSLQDAEEGDGYLICTNEDIIEIRQEEGKMIIKSEKETFEGWQALHIVQKETERSLDYDWPLLTNHKKDSFFRRISGKTGGRLLTRADLFRRIMELDIDEYIEAAGYEICEGTKGFQQQESMNRFVSDELFPLESRKVLLLKFVEKKPGYYLNDSMVRFAASQMQMELGEYRCVGVIVRDGED